MNIYTTSWHSRYNLNSRLKSKFKRKLNIYQKKNPKIHPFSVATKTLAINWWAKAWNAHLKNYTFKNLNLDKGKLHLRCGALADFKIHSDHVEAIVLGSKTQPYQATVTFKPLAKTHWEKIQKKYLRHFESFEKILDHHFPKEMADLYSGQPTGLFPSKEQITFHCTCSDRASICKHTAVALFALGAMIDQDNQLLFRLRGVNILELISQAIHAERKNLLKKAHNKNRKILKETNLSQHFNIDI